jgi:hypothetical protein
MYTFGGDLYLFWNINESFTFVSKKKKKKKGWLIQVSQKESYDNIDSKEGVYG